VTWSWRRTASLGLWALVVLQVAIPCSYYAGLREPDDERFAWRMFSAVRVRNCRVRVVRGGSEAPSPVAGLHSSWVRAMERGRSAVIARYLRDRCTVEATSLERRCRDAAGHPLPTLTYRYDCASDALRTAEAR